MFDKDAIESIKLATGIKEAGQAISIAMATTGEGELRQDTVTLPETFKLHDLEEQKPTRRRARGIMSTQFIAAFAAYALAHAEAGASVFINPSNLNATAVLNLGTPAAPGHADNTAVFMPKATAPYIALTAIASRAQSQVDIAEFLEDWTANIQCFAGNEEVRVPTAVAAVRKITIESMRKQETNEQQLSASKSAFESIQATSQDPLPTLIYFSCAPYADLSERLFVLRLSVLTGEAKPKLLLRIQKVEEHSEQMADEMVAKLHAAFGGETKLPVMVGAYAKKS